MSVILGFAVGVFVVFGIYLKFCFVRLYRYMKSIKQMQEKLATFSEQDYIVRFEAISEIFMDNSDLKDIWADYRKSLTIVHNANGQDEIYSTTAASDFFSLDNLTKDLSMGFWQNYGGTFTGLGILGTFLGLTFGINDINFSSQDVNVLKEGITGLLSGIQFAFVTSVIGIIFALLYGFLHNCMVSEVREKIDELALHFDSTYRRNTTEQWLANSYLESQEQTSTLRTLSDDIAFHLGDILDKQMGSNFNALCQKLDGQLRPVFEKLLTTIAELNNNGANAIADTVSSQAGKELQGFAQTLTDLQTTMKNNIMASQEVSEKMNNRLLETVEKMEETLTKGAEESVNKNKTALEASYHQVETIVDTMGTKSEEMMNNIATTISNVQAMMASSIENSQSIAAQMNDEMQKAVKTQTEMFASSSRRSQENIEKAVNSIHTMIIEHNSAMDQTYAKMSDMVKQTSQIIEELQAAGNTVKNSVQPVAEASQKLSEELLLLRTETKKNHDELNKQIEKLALSGEQTEKNLRALMKNIEAAEQRTAEAWANYDSNFNNIGESLCNATGIITDRLNAYNESMRTGMQNQLSIFDKSFSDAVSQLQGVIEELKDSFEEQKDAR